MLQNMNLLKMERVLLQTLKIGLIQLAHAVEDLQEEKQIQCLTGQVLAGIS